MPVTINGDGSITGLSAGGLPAGSVTDATISGMAASKLSGALPAISGASLTGLSSGLAMADQWRVASDNGETDASTIGGFERNDTDFSQIGTGMTHSSGVFTFPATGIYKIEFHASSRRAANQNLNMVRYQLQKSSDSGGNWNNIAFGSGQMASAGDNQETFTCGNAILDVTNASTYRVRLYVDAATHVRPLYSTSYNYTYLTFLKLGDT